MTQWYLRLRQMTLPLIITESFPEVGEAWSHAPEGCQSSKVGVVVVALARKSGDGTTQLISTLL